MLAKLAAMRRILTLALLVAVSSACAKMPANTQSGARHSWTIPHRLRIAMPAEPGDLNPYDSDLDMTYDIASLVYSYLIVADDRGVLIGDLAEAVPTLKNGGISPDGLTYTYRLRRGVRWHDGSPFTSADVVASWHAILDPHRNVLDRDIYARVRAIDTPDADTIVVHLGEKYPPFVTRFFAPLQESGRPILSAKAIARDPAFRAGAVETHPMGTGPFIFVSWKRGESIVFRRNDAYFRGRPSLDRIDLVTVPDFRTAAAELAAHDIDLVAYAAAPLLPAYRAIADVRIDTVPWNVQTQLLLNASKPALRDRTVRAAIAAALPYATILSGVTDNVYEPARNTTAPTSLGFEALPARELDLAGANRMLDAAGWKLGTGGVRERGSVKLAFTIASLAGGTSFERIAVLAQASLAKAGIAASIKTYSLAQLAAPDGPVLSGTYDLSIFTQTLSWDPDQYATLGCDQWFPHGSNILRYCDPVLDALERRGLQTNDAAARAAIYRRAGRVIWNGVPLIPLYQGRRLIVASPDLHHYLPNATATPWWNAWVWDI